MWSRAGAALVVAGTIGFDTPSGDRSAAVARRLRRVRRRSDDMARGFDVSRRAFLAGLACNDALPELLRAAESDPDVPLITKKVEKLWSNPRIPQANDMQFEPEGLWILDQKDPNKAFLVKPEDGTIIRELQTESIHGSGITFG